MPKRKRIQREHTEDWETVQQYTLWPEQTAYELLRPIVLLAIPLGNVRKRQEPQRALSTGRLTALPSKAWSASSPLRAYPKTSASLVGSAHALLVSMRRSVDFRQTLNESPAHQSCAERYAQEAVERVIYFPSALALADTVFQRHA